MVRSDPLWLRRRADFLRRESELAPLDIARAAYSRDMAGALEREAGAIEEVHQAPPEIPELRSR
jgi:hypothetical protein